MATRQQLLDTALDHYADRQRLVFATEQAMASIWSEVNPARIADSWANLLPEAVGVTSGAQLAAARPAQSYVDEVLADEDASTAGATEVNPGGFAGQASDARGLIGLLTNPVVVTLLSIQDGIDVARALGLGRQNLQMLSATQVADAGRLADQTGITARPAAHGYTRVAVGNSCARCLILAGTFYRWNRGFQRHPKCDCIHLPAMSSSAKALRNPQQIYDRMTKAERTRAGFTLADQRAIAEGADLAQVVNAHRGMYVAGGRKLTSEGTTKRGLARKFKVDPETGRLVRKTPREAAEPRLSVDEIFREAGDDRDLAVALLGENAYLRIGVPAPRREAIDLSARANAPSGATGAGAAPAVTIRPELDQAKSITAVNQAFAREYQRITGHRVFTIDLQGSIQTAKEHAEGLLRGLERFPDANLHEVVTILANPTDSRYAEAAFSYVGFSEEWTRNRARYLKAIQGDEAAGFHVPNSGNPVGVAIHEFGHILDVGTLGSKIGPQVDAFLQRVSAQLGQPVDKVIEIGVSGYALKSRSELIAEAFTDVILNGPQASAISRGIFDLLEAEYKRPGSDRLGGAIIAQPKASRPGSVGHLTVPQLRALARERGLVVPPGAKKADLVRLIDEAPQPSSAVMFGDLSELRQVSEQTRGSNPAAMFEAPDGSRWYVKAVADQSHANNEALAAALYREAGIDVPVVVRSNVGPPGLDGEAFVASRVDPRSTPATLAALNDPASVARMREGFAADAWLANWDVMGGGYHNIVMVGGGPVRVDPGGALLYRGGLGRPKGNSFGKSVVEWDSLRDPKRSRNAADLYEGMTAAELADSAARVMAVTPARIRALVGEYEMPASLADTLIARQQDLGRRLSELGTPPAARGPVDETLRRAAKDADALAVPPIQMTRVRQAGGDAYADLIPDPAQRAAAFDSIEGYVDTPRVINQTLRAPGQDRFTTPEIFDEIMGEVANIDRAMAASRLPKPIVVYRGRRGDSVLGPRDTWGDDLTGREWVDPAPASTSAMESVGKHFAGADGVVMRIVVPEGTGAVQLSAKNYESEILLERGLRYRVVRDNGTVNGQRRLDVEVVPAAPVDNTAKRAAARARQGDIDTAQTRATALADLDEKLAAGATPATLKAELDVLAQTKALAAADIIALRRVVATGDRAKIDAAVDRLTKKYKLTGVVRAGDVTTMREGFEVVGGRTVADGAEVRVVRRGTEMVRDGERIVLSPPLVRELDAADLARIRQAAIDEKRARADILSTLFERIDAEVDAAVFKREAARLRKALPDVDPAMAAVFRAAETGDPAKLARALDAAAKKLEITRVGGDYGKPLAFDRKVHEAIAGGRIDAGETVELVRPAWTMTYRGETIQLGKAVVQEVDLAELRERAVKAVEDLLDRTAKPTAAQLKKVDAVKVGTASKTKTVAYDPKVHDAGGAKVPAGAKVRIVEPGYSVTVGRETVVVRKPVVEPALRPSSPTAPAAGPRRIPPAQQVPNELGLRKLDDDALLDLYSNISRQEVLDEDALLRIDAEMLRREETAAGLAAGAESAARRFDPLDSGRVEGDDPLQRRVDQLIAQGRSFESAYAEVFDLDDDAFRRSLLGDQVDQYRTPGETRDAVVRRLYDEAVHLRYLEAERATRGNLLNAAGKAAKIDPITLFSGPRARARKYASDELKEFWEQTGGRPTLTEFRAAMLGRRSDARAARRLAGGNERDFGL